MKHAAQIQAEFLKHAQAYNEALAGESTTDALKEKWDEENEVFNGVTNDDLEEYARIVAYKVIHNIENGHKVDKRMDPIK